MKEHLKKMRRRSFGKTKLDGEVWLLDEPHEVETSKEEDNAPIKATVDTLGIYTDVLC
jgi:hypothetical protein